MKPTRICGLVLLLAAAPLLADERPVDRLIREFTGEVEARKWTAAELRGSYGAILEALYDDMAGEDLPKRERAQQTFHRICIHAARPGAETERVVLCNVILAWVSAKPTSEARIWLIRQLEHIGRAESVWPLAEWLTDADARVRDCARRALQANPDKKAVAALEEALFEAKNTAQRVALIHALGARRDGADKSVPSLGVLLSHPDAAVVAAAAAALGRLGGARAAAALAAALPKAAPKRRPILADALLACAEFHVGRGELREAESLYRGLFKDAMPRRIRVAALRGLAQCGAKAVPTLIEALRGEDGDLAASAARFCVLAPGRSMSSALTEALPGLSPDRQVDVLRALGDRGEKAAQGAVLKAAGSEHEPVRLAALEALIHVGDAGCIPVLATKAAAGRGRERDAARNALRRLPGQGINRAILDHAAEAAPAAGAELFASLGPRRAFETAGAVLKAASDPDAAVRRAALESLTVLAGCDELAALVDLLVKAADDAERLAAERAVLAACRRTDPPAARVKPLAAALAKAPVPARCAIVRVLGRLADADTLAAVRGALKDADPAVRDAAVRALADWPDASPIEDVLRIARTAKRPAHRVLALRGYVRMVGLRSTRQPVERTLTQCGGAMGLARRVEEKAQILAALGRIAHVDALRMVKPYLEAGELTEEAAAAAVAIVGGRIGEPHNREAKTVLRKILAVSKNAKTQAKARDLLKRLGG